MDILFFIFILISLIVVHEFGHFIVAKLFGIRVDEFSVGFPPRLVSKQWGETRYSFGALLLGGYVSIFGENPQEGGNDPRALNNTSRWKQATVVVAGVFFNMVFAWLALSVGYMVGLPTSSSHTGYGQVQDAEPTILGVYPDSPADRAGLMSEDVVVALESGTAKLEIEKLSTNQKAETVRNFIAEHEDESLVFTVMRGTEQKVFLAKAEEGLVEGRKAVGIEVADFGILQLPVHLALIEGAHLTIRMTAMIAHSLVGFFENIVRGAADFSTVAGPIGIVSVGASAVDDGFIAAIMLTALISINLAILNLLPIPGLDGGRLLVMAIEGLTRRTVPERLTTALTLAGFAFLITLMVVVSFYDIARLTQ